MEKILLNSWRMTFAQNSHVVKNKISLTTTESILSSGQTIIPASVPGNFELDFSKAGLLPEDIFFGDNITKVQDFEKTHLWYFTEFELEDKNADAFILFEGIDTVADIYIDGKKFAFTENMLIPHEFSLENVSAGRHDLVVHITPAHVYTDRFQLSTRNRGMQHNMDSILIRKAPYMYGWDIMPRAVSGGLWKPVSIVYKPKNRIEDYFCYIQNYVENQFCDYIFKTRIHIEEDDLRRYSLKIEGKCGNSVFFSQTKAYSVNNLTGVRIENPLLWWPKNYGEPNLYRTKITLFLDGVECDSVEFNLGVRFIELERTSCAGPDGKFFFRINGKKIFAQGSNWVPTDTFPSRQAEYDLRGLKLLDDLNCNIVRCWGGNIYPDDAFFDYCDAHGILVWQDFAMACGIYPTDDRMCKLLKEEAQSVVLRLRNHASLALWSGDNECDGQYLWTHTNINGKWLYSGSPDDNVLTRKILPEVLDRLDGFRPYLPSSPYLDKEAYETANPSEDHLWGPRDYFKGEYYKTNSVCHFASETGYHGCPAPATLRKFISEDQLDDFGNDRICTNRQWLAHATCPEPTIEDGYSYRIPLMTRQIIRLFGDYKDGGLESYALKSQISQAEAFKFFIEHFRIQNNYRSGIIWWNAIDGWPQISDAVVDWYGTKKLAYHYIKRCQTPFIIMCDEPDSDGNLRLVAVNDSRDTVTVSYTVTDALTGERLCGDTITVEPDGNITAAVFKEESRYYLISWSGDVCGMNHFTGRIGDCISLGEYVKFLETADLYWKLEGFSL